MLLYYLSMIESAEDRNKFERIYLLYRSLMMHTAMHYLHDPSLAEDCVHNAFLNILENLDKIQDPKSPETKCLLVIITERRAIDYIRKHRREISLENVPEAYHIPPDDDNILSDKIANLPHSYRTAILLRYVYGYTTNEMASLLHMTPSGVRKLLNRAKTRLKEDLRHEK